MSIRHASVSNLVALLGNSLKERGGDQRRAPTPEELESASFLIYQAMTGRTRAYHGLAHIFIVAHGLPALARLAAIYHDAVYFHVDRGVSPAVSARIGGLIEQRDGKVFIAASLDATAAEIATVFGLTAGQELGVFGGLSEFLSAMLALRELERFLSRKDLWAIAACIEATIPFRKATAGQTLDAILGERLTRLGTGNDALSASEIDEILGLAAQLANSDLQSFGQTDLSDFLDDTWKLLPEGNQELEVVGAYSIRKYREALSRMEGFLSNLDSGVIFRQHGATPSNADLDAMRTRAAGTLRSGGEYLRAKIAALLVLEALAELTGGDGPISYFTGAADSGESQVHDLLHGVGPSSKSAPATLDDKVLRVLKHGRGGATRFDTSASPLAAYLYESMSTAGIAEHIGRARLVHSGGQSWEWFLRGLPHALVQDVGQAVADIAIARKDRMHETLRRIADIG